MHDNCLPGKVGHCANKLTNGNPTITIRESPPSDLNSTINPMIENINQPQSDTDLEPLGSQLIDSISDPPNPALSCPMLPECTPMSSPTFKWGDLSGPEFARLLDTTYAVVVHWRCNCFSVPFGKMGRDFVSELSWLYLAYGSASALEAVVQKAAIVLPILLLQKPSKRSKTKIILNVLKGDQLAGLMATWKNW